MPLEFIDHYSIRVRTPDLPQVRDFYQKVLGLADGERPPFEFAGNWLYAGASPVVHLIGTDDDAQLAAGVPSSGKLDHISFRCSGLEQMRTHLRGLGINADERAVPSSRLHQLFLRDPAGILVELTFDLSRDAK